MSNPSIPTSISERFRPEHWLLFALIGALVAGVIAFYGCNFFATRDLREMAAAPNGGLEWLRREFHLSGAQFQKIEALQSAYAPVCNEMCRLVQKECQQQMLAHIYQVSAQMNPADAQNYLRLMKSRVIQPALSSDTAVRATTE